MFGWEIMTLDVQTQLKWYKVNGTKVNLDMHKVSHMINKALHHNIPPLGKKSIDEYYKHEVVVIVFV